jgi:hypothetical protein
MPGDDLAVLRPNGKEVEFYNSNQWQVYKCSAYWCGQNGLFVSGGEAQAGLCLGFQAIGNGGWGIYESSLLGNAYEGCTTESNKQGSYKVDNDPNYSTFTACYAEVDQTPDFAHGTNALILGGSLASSNLVYQRVGNQNSKLHFRGLQDLDTETKIEGDFRSVEVQIPASDEENEEPLQANAIYLHTPHLGTQEVPM